MKIGETKSSADLTILRVVTLCCVIALTVLLIIYRAQVQKLQGYGYPGIFLFSILVNPTILIPIPGVLFTSAMGAVFNPWWVALAAGSGAAIGELSGYLAGFSGQSLIGRNQTSERMEYWVRRYGNLSIFLLALIPNPLFDLAGMTAGALKMPIYRFIVFLWLGKIGKMLLFAFLGSSLLRLFNAM